MNVNSIVAYEQALLGGGWDISPSTPFHPRELARRLTALVIISGILTPCMLDQLVIW